MFKSTIVLSIFLLIVVLVSTAVGAEQSNSLDMVAYLKPRSGSKTRILTSGSLEVFVQVYSEGVTDAPGQGDGIVCEVYWSPVSEFGGEWTEVHTTEMIYYKDIDNTDEYKGSTGALPVDKYEYTARCSDDAGITWYWPYLSDGNAMLEVVSSPDNGFLIPGSSLTTNTGLTLTQGEQIGLRAYGLVNTWPANSNNPDSDPNGNGNPCTSDCLLPSAQFGALVGRIGEGEWFFVGRSRVIQANDSGTLILAVNDNPY